MRLAAIRAGLASVLDEVPGVRVFQDVPEAMPASGATAVVIVADSPYVTYAEGAGRVQQNEVRVRLVIVPAGQAGSARVLDEIDDLLSTGTDSPRSLRDLLQAHLSVDGTACSVSMRSASIRQVQVNELSMVVGEADLLIVARSA